MQHSLKELMIDRRTMLWTLGAMAGSVATGCKAVPKPVESWDDRFGPAEAPSRSFAPRILLALEPGRRQYLWVSEEGEETQDAGGSAAQAAESGDGEDGDASRSLRLERVADDPKYPYRLHTANGRIEHIGLGKEGSLIVGAVEDLEHEALTRYDPALPLIPADLKQDEPMTSKAKLTVLDRNNPDQERDSGSCEQTITYEADQRVITPAGQFDCLRLRTEYKAELTLATVNQTSRDWYAPRVGLVAKEHEERVRAFILNIDEQWRILLRERPERG